MSSSPFESIYSHKFVGTFSCAQIVLREARERELATHLMRNRRAVGLLNPMRAIKIEGKNRGAEWTTPLTTACPEAGKYKCENIYIYIHISEESEI